VKAGPFLNNMTEQNDVSRIDLLRMARFVLLAFAMAYALSVVLRHDSSNHVFILMNGIDKNLVESLPVGFSTDSMFKTFIDDRGLLNQRAPEPVLSENFKTQLHLKKHNSQGEIFVAGEE
jgi:hypothetical protein